MKSRTHSYLLTFGHICTDINQGALPAMLPFLIIAYNLNYAAAAALVLSSSIVSSVIQPLFGWLGDRVERPWFMSLGILLAGSGIALLGFMDDYPLMLLCASLTGVGVALFHPEGGKLANVVAGDDKGAGVSNFTVGGNIGFALGPIIAIFALETWGIHGTALFLVPTVIMALLLFTQTGAYRRFTLQEAERRAAAGPSGLIDDWPGFLKISSVNFLRSIVATGLMVFIPLYWIGILKQSASFAALMLTLFSAAGAVATWLGGRIADRIGFTRTILISFFVSAPLLLAFLFVDNIVLATTLIVLVSFTSSASYGPIVALGQSYLPNRLGLASGISLGVVVSVGGAASPLIGLVGDRFGLWVAMALICALSFVAALLTLPVVGHRPSSAAQVESAVEADG
ncbi:MAG: MFS transporter [Coriobacteriales bacterium]|jgi:FSR family fosmidomycin resistance protein-like MFS transporter|nr:MFS transporter [Coriobacteriales bacterium]